MKKQVSIKVYMDEDLYSFYKNIEDGRKGQVVRDALMLYKNLRLYSSANSLVEILAEIKEGFQKIEHLLAKKPDIAGPADTDNDQQQPNSRETTDMAVLFEGFVQDVGLE
jgi:hypothetical protein